MTDTEPTGEDLRAPGGGESRARRSGPESEEDGPVADREIAERFPTAESAGPPTPGGRLGLVVRRGGLLLLALVVVAACLGVLGPRTATTSATGPDGTLELEHAAVTRPGADTEVVVTLRADPAPESLVLRIPPRALAVLGIDRFVPEPVEQRAEGESVVLEFAVAGGSPVEVRMSGRTSPTQPPGRHRWSVQRLVAGTPVATLDATTWVVP